MLGIRFWQKFVKWTRGASRGGDWGDRPPNTYKGKFFHHDFLQFGKQHSRHKTIFRSLLCHSSVVKYTSSNWAWQTFRWTQEKFSHYLSKRENNGFISTENAMAIGLGDFIASCLLLFRNWLVAECSSVISSNRHIIEESGRTLLVRHFQLHICSEFWSISSFWQKSRTSLYMTQTTNRQILHSLSNRQGNLC